MRNLLIAVSFTAVALGSIGQQSSRSMTSQLPDGTLSGNAYTNDALKLRFEFPSAWTAIADPKGPVRLDPRNPDGRANQCSRILLELSAPSKGDGRFTSFGTLVAIEPQCLSKARFPRSEAERDQFNKVTNEVLKYFAHSPYFSPYGVKVFLLGSPGHMQVLFTGGMIINAIEEGRAAAKEPLNVNTSFVLGESNGYWVAWAYVADDPSVEELKKHVKVVLADAPSP